VNAQAGADRTERIQKVLARAGLASRREAERWLAEGRISVNGAIVTEPGTKVDPEVDHIRVDGRKLRPEPKHVYYLLNKPVGFVTTTKDPQNRPIVTDLMRRVRERVFPVGRLDYNTSGLIVLTNDGDLADRLMKPASRCPKIYEAKLKGVPPAAVVRRLSRGVVLDGRRTMPCRIRPLRTTRSGTWMEIELREGRRNQIRRMFLQAGHPVSKLKRVAIGPLRDRQLPGGKYRPLTDKEVELLKESLQ